MRRVFTLKGSGLGTFEQDVAVTLTEKKDVPVEVGDEVFVLVRAQVERVYGDGGDGEVDLVNAHPVKVVEVIRQKKGS